MIKIFYNIDNISNTFYFTFNNCYTIIYIIDKTGNDWVTVTYYFDFDIMHMNKNQLNTHEILFNKDIKKIINKFIKLPTKKIINDLLNDDNRNYLTYIKNRSELELIISSIKIELRRILNGSA